MDENFDLFGQPILDRQGLRGRPPYVATEKDRNKIKLLLALGWSIERMANGIGVSPATLKRHFRAELKVRTKMRDGLEARRFEIAMELANAGNVAALKELGKMIEKNDAMVAARAYRGDDDEEKKPEKIGKKEQAQRDAEQAEQSDTWGDDLQFRGRVN
ncbi:helix-turn-helix transcriptional regulator [Agrobacterium genomosp. 3 str. CIP 111-78]|uniref:Helix-turn-helix transcriptional regulator n=1 Tax=Agrobacterium tumefaciens TaxID=358 RepID=A0AAE6BS56_AGRTU|nr:MULTISPECIES: AraC family transcriptional regulator [Agrobacterium tumefaciens complex]MCA2372214.1 helix-turn-helix transcriptional regulator [Agrobacterium tomkonis CIP 111-78]QCM02038.1 helix-turn-helix transcriptional regulator [Agrobacterium tumefaciens]